MKNMPSVCLKKYNSYTSDFCCELVKKTQESASNFYGNLTGKFGGTVYSHVTIIVILEYVCVSDRVEVVTVTEHVVQLLDL